MIAPELSETEFEHIVTLLSHPTLVKYFKLLQQGQVESLANAVPKGSLEEHFREIRFNQGVLHTLNSLLAIGEAPKEKG